MIREICGITPDASTLRWNTSAYPARLATPSWDARPARVVEPDDRRADPHRLVHHLADLFGVRLAQAAPEHGEVLAEHEDEPTLDGAEAGDHAVAGDALLADAEIRRAVLDEHVPLFERALVEQQLEPLARGQLALGVLRRDALLATRRRAPRRGVLPTGGACPA